MAVSSTINNNLGTVYEGEHFSLPILLVSDLLEPVTVTKITEVGNRNDNLIYTLGINPRISGEFDSVFIQDSIMTYQQDNEYQNYYQTVQSFDQMPADTLQIIKYRIDPRLTEIINFDVEYREGNIQTGSITLSITVQNNFSFKAKTFKDNLDRLELNYASSN